MLARKAQVTLFIIAGIVILLIIGLPNQATTNPVFIGKTNSKLLTNKPSAEIGS